MTTYRCAPIERPQIDDDFTRADLVFYGVDHSGVSYEGLVYVNPSGDEALGGRDPARGYAGSFTVFGHAGCYGDAGHCAPEQGFHDEFDRRPRHPLTPFTRTVVATEAIRRALRSSSPSIDVVVVSNVPEAEGAEDGQEPLRFDSVRLLTYEG